MYLLDEKYLQININENKLIFNTDINIIPNKIEFEKIKEILCNYFLAIKKSKKKFFQIFKINNATINTIYNYKEIIQWTCDLFNEHRYIFREYLYCTIIIIDNDFIRNSINVLLKIYNPTQPVHFILNINELENIIKRYN